MKGDIIRHWLVMLLLKKIDKTKFCHSYRLRNYYYKSLCLLVLLVIVVPYVTAHWDPYEILGVRKDASLDQIKRAYRDLAKKLHPDKRNSNEDDSGRKFIDVNKAFNILKDPDRRNRYDQLGETEETRNSRGYHHSGHQHQNRQTREYWAHNGFRTFTFFASSSESPLRKRSITTKQYYNDYIKESKQRPFFIFFYSDFCPSCSMIESTWIRIADELAKFNVGSFAINVQQELRLSRDLDVTSIPHIACLIDGELNPYHQSELSLTSIVKFTKGLLPNDLVQTLKNEEDQDRFIWLSPQNNRLSAIFIHNDSHLKLRYLLLAYELRQYYSFGHISTKNSDDISLLKRYNITEKSMLPHLLVFDENIKRPVTSIHLKSDDFNGTTIKRHLNIWPFIKLPRLSSQQKFDDLCLYTIPRVSDKVKARLCVILFASNTPSSLPTRKKMIEFVELNNLYHNDEVVFVYLDPHKQTQFVQSLLLETEQTQPAFVKDALDSTIILIVRDLQNNRKAHHKWISAKWDPDVPDELDAAKIELYSVISDYKRKSPSTFNKVVLGVLIDEEGPGLMDRILWRSLNYFMRLLYYLTSREPFSAIMILIACAFITSLFIYRSPMYSQAHSHYREPNTRQRKQETHQYEGSSKQLTDDMKILELKAETYNGMIRLLKPGYRSIIVLLDGETKSQLLTHFRKAVWPYRRNKTLLFGYLCLDKNLQWYKSLLEEVLGVSDLHVNKKYCIGTVLSLNGFKKYLRVYHAKHHEIDYYDDATENDGSFLGFNENDEDDDRSIESGVSRQSAYQHSNETLYTVDNLLEKLPIWLDKMFDGLTKRYFIKDWPEEMK